MKHRVKKIRLNRKKSPRELLVRNMATSVILYDKVKTTKAKASLVAPLVEKLITTAKGKDTVHAIREINKQVLDKNASRKLMQELKDKYKDRTSGYTRTTNLGPRTGDNAPMVQLELV